MALEARKVFEVQEQNHLFQESRNAANESKSDMLVRLKGRATRKGDCVWKKLTNGSGISIGV